MKDKVIKILSDSFGCDVKIERPPEGCGDYSSNIAFLLSKEKKKSPHIIAEELKEKIDSDLFEKVEIKNGFLNFFLSEKSLKEEVLRVVEEESNYGRGEEGEKIVIDYSSPNIAKPFGIGHLRSTIIGQSLYNIYSFMGSKVYGINHLGDWGTQYGKLLYQIKKEKKNPEDLSVNELEEMYVRFHKEAEDNPEMEEEAREWFLKLEKGEEEPKRYWEICREKSIEEFEKVYKRLGVKIDYTLGESFYEDKLEEIVKEAKEKKVVKESEGALIMEFDNLPPAMVLKSDGSTTYFTRDLAAAKYRLLNFSPDKIIYEVGGDQVLHMKQLFNGVEKLGWAEKEKFFHVAHGMFRLKEGKLSTRRGRTIHLLDVLSTAKEKAMEIVEESSSLSSTSSKEKDKIADIIGIGAVKYNDLKRHYKRDVIFDWDNMLALKGDSGPYLQYTCVRCSSILEKYGKEYKKELQGELNEKEWQVVKRIIHFKEELQFAGENYSPNIIAEYTYNLAKDFNSLYDKHKISDNNNRIIITKATFIILTRCLNLLTIEVPKKM